MSKSKSDVASIATYWHSILLKTWCMYDLNYFHFKFQVTLFKISEKYFYLNTKKVFLNPEKSFFTWNSSNFAITVSEWKWPNMFVLAHARWLVLHNPFSGKVNLNGGMAFSCEQSMPIYKLLHLHTPEKPRLLLMISCIYRYAFSLYQHLIPVAKPLQYLYLFKA